MSRVKIFPYLVGSSAAKYDLRLSDSAFYGAVRGGAKKVEELIIPRKDALAFKVKKGQLFRIVCIEGPQVADLNVFQLHNPDERFYASKTRQIHATHLKKHDKLWSNFPYMRPLATITADSLDWYNWDEDGAGIHDVIGSRCDPYTNAQLNRENYDFCCHSNLTRAVGRFGISEDKVHDVLNVFMCSGFDRKNHKYFMKASPVRPDDYIEFLAETDLLAAVSACPFGDCGQFADGEGWQNAETFPLKIEIYDVLEKHLAGFKEPAVSSYKGNHGCPVK